MKKLTIAALIIVASLTVYGQDMRQNSYYSLFADHKANRIGDAVTIIVYESSVASNNSETSSGRTSNIGTGFSGAMGTSTLPKGDITLGTDNKFSGAGATKTTGNVRTKISAVVDTVLGNGNLVIKGSRKIIINGEEQLVTIKGVVRPSDIDSENSVLSYNISDAEINFSGSGIIDDAQKPGWLTKLFHWLF